MANVYDPENDEQDLSALNPGALSDMEQEYSTPGDEQEDNAIEGGRAKPEDLARGGMGRKLRLNSAGKDAKEQAALDDKLSGLKDQVGDAKEDGGFFKKGKDGGKSRVGAAGGLLKNRKALFGVGGGALGIILVAGSIFSFLHTFQLDHFFKNVDQKTSQRLTSSLDIRNKHLIRAYIQIRVTELEGRTANDNLYFRANKVDTGNPIRDWYTTMRTSNFEKEVLEKQGIVFTNFVDSDGKVNIGKINLGRTDAASKDLIDKYSLNKSAAWDTPEKVIVNLNNMPSSDMEQLFTVDKFDTHKAARKSVKEVVNSDVPWYRTFKRRHVRRDFANQVGIKKWRIFEKTRDKVSKNIQNRKDKLLNKVLERYFAGNPSSQKLMKCLFSDGRCSANTDSAAEENKAERANAPADPNDPLSQGDTQTETGTDGPKTTNLDTAGSGNEITDAMTKEIKNSVEAETTDAITAAAGTEFSPIAKIALNLATIASGDAVGSTIPVNPVKIWTWAKRIAKIDGLLRVADHASKLSRLVMNARRSQVEGLYATYSIANDQIKSGQLVGDELSTFFETTKGLGNSEGWGVVTNQLNSNGSTVSAAGVTNPEKEAYCAKPSSQRKFDEFAYFCDDQRPDNGGNSQAISDSYSKSVGKVAQPIAATVNAIDKSPIGKLADWVTGAFDSVLSKVTEPFISAVMDSGIGRSVQAFMGTFITKFIGFLGAGPMFDGSEPGLGNLLVAGASATAENTSRASGGIKSTAKSLAYSNRVAAEYETTQQSRLSPVERYASLNNPRSLASSALFSISSNLSLTTALSKLASLTDSLPQMFGSALTGRAFADQTQSGSTVADWAGIEKYDIPQECLELEPLDTDYAAKATNASSVLSGYGISGFSADMATMRDTDKFWKAVYDKIGQRDDAQAIAEKIYNCALLDARVMGSLGASFGYENDGAYNPNGASTVSADTPSSTGSLGISPDGFVFPLKTTKSAITDHKPAAWCTTNTTNCHHDYNAADIFADTGTVVLSPTGGVVVSTSSRSGGTGSHVVLKSDKGFIFYFAHMKEGSIAVSKGQTITAGTRLGVVGTNADAAGTASHLHFDAMASPPATSRPSCRGAACAKYPFLPVQPALIAAYNALPN